MKTESSSFRLDKEMFSEFKKKAKKQGLTTNSLINKVMKEYVDWSSVIPSIQLIPLSASLIVKFLKKHNEEEIRKAVREHVEEHIVENLLMVKNEESLDAFLEVVQNWCDSSGFPITSKEKNGTTNYSIRHNQGEKFSILLEEDVKTVIEVLTKEKAKIKHTTNAISFWV
jgi:predicted NACHT family NTPase